MQKDLLFSDLQLLLITLSGSFTPVDNYMQTRQLYNLKNKYFHLVALVFNPYKSKL